MNVIEVAGAESDRVLRSLREAVVAMLAVAATLLCTLSISPGRGAAVFAVVLCLALTRHPLGYDWRHQIQAAIVLPAVGVATLGVGVLLYRLPWVGAMTFVGGMFLSIWLRRFGPVARRSASLLALPLVALLVTPRMPAVQGGILSGLLPLAIALLAMMWVSLLQALSYRIGFLTKPRKHRVPRPEVAPGSSIRPVASTRMALQMAAALTVAFIVGYVFFAQRWAWIVLTAFIVISGSRGRLDVAYKSVLRIVGAAAGTVAAVILNTYVAPHGQVPAVVILVAVFLGVWLRPLGYAWWALFVTVALALLQGFADERPLRILWLRLEEIMIGAVISIASVWWLLPVRSTDVLRRRMASALGSLAIALDPKTSVREPDDFLRALADVEQLAPPFRASRPFARWFLKWQPAECIEVLLSCRGAACAVIECGSTHADLRRAMREARKGLRELPVLLQSLKQLHHVLSGHGSVQSDREAEFDDGRSGHAQLVVANDSPL